MLSAPPTITGNSAYGKTVKIRRRRATVRRKYSAQATVLEIPGWEGRAAILPETIAAKPGDRRSFNPRIAWQPLRSLRATWTTFVSRARGRGGKMKLRLRQAIALPAVLLSLSINFSDSVLQHRINPRSTAKLPIPATRHCQRGDFRHDGGAPASAPAIQTTSGNRRPLFDDAAGRKLQRPRNTKLL